MAVLIILSGKQSGRKIRLPQRELTIGRDEGCFLRVASVDVSRQHSQLSPSPRGWLIRDLKSQNGTWLNGVRIVAETLLQCGDELVVGHMTFQWEGPRPDQASASVLEDSIVEWLSEHDTSIPQGHAAGDTTILDARDGSPGGSAAAKSSSDPPAVSGSKRAASSPLNPGPGPAAGSTSDHASSAPTSVPGTVPSRSAHDGKQTLAQEAQSVIRHFVEQVGDTKPPALADE
jgi:hypothetical protein